MLLLTALWIFLIKQYKNPSHIGISTRFSLYIIIIIKKTCVNLNKLPGLL